MNLSRTISRTINPNIGLVGFEAAYIALPFVSKTLLVVWYFLAVPENVVWLETCPYGDNSGCKSPLLKIEDEEEGEEEEDSEDDEEENGEDDEEEDGEDDEDGPLNGIFNGTLKYL